METEQKMHDNYLHTIWMHMTQFYLIIVMNRDFKSRSINFSPGFGNDIASFN